MTEEEFIKELFREACRQDLEQFEEETKDIEVTCPVKFKKKMNRLFREELGTNKIPHPEVDNTYERVRSWFVRLIKKK